MPQQVDRGKAQRMLQKRLDRLGKAFGFEDTAYKAAVDKILAMTGARNVHKNSETGRVTFSTKGIKQKDLKSARDFLKKQIPAPQTRYRQILDPFRKEQERQYIQNGMKLKKERRPTEGSVKRWERWRRRATEDLDRMIVEYYNLFGSGSLYQLLGDEWRPGNDTPKTWDDIDEAIRKLDDKLSKEDPEHKKRKSEIYDKLKRVLLWL